MADYWVMTFNAGAGDRNYPSHMLPVSQLRLRLSYFNIYDVRFLSRDAGYHFGKSLFLVCTLRKCGDDLSESPPDWLRNMNINNNSLQA